MEDVALISNGFLAFGKDCGLPSDLSKSANHLTAAIYEAVESVWYTHVRAKLLHEFLSSAEIMSWHPRK